MFLVLTFLRLDSPILNVAVDESLSYGFIPKVTDLYICEWESCKLWMCPHDLTAEHIAEIEEAVSSGRFKLTVDRARSMHGY